MLRWIATLSLLFAIAACDSKPLEPIISPEQAQEMERQRLAQAEEEAKERERQRIVREEEERENAMQEAVREIVKNSLKDPDSALFRDQSWTCGEVNAKNSFGGYVGYRKFAVLSDGFVAYENDLKGDKKFREAFEELWEICRAKKARGAAAAAIEIPTATPSSQP